MPALRLLVAATLVAVALTLVGLAAAAGNGLTAKLSGKYLSASPTGSGTAKITLEEGRVCWQLTFEGIDKPTASGIAKAPPPASGPAPVFIPLTARFDAGGGSGCGRRSTDKVNAVLANPSGFYVRIKTIKYPNGAIGGRLHRVG